METLIRDVRYGFRALIKAPGFAFVSIFALALGIGVNTAIFSVFNNLLFHPLPVKNPQQLVLLAVKQPGIELPVGIVSYPDYLEYRNLRNVYSDVVAYTPVPVNLSSAGQGDRCWASMVTANFFTMLGVEAIRGRTFSANEGQEMGADPLIVLSYGFWKQRFGGDPSAVGKVVLLNNHPFTIIGIAPENFHGVQSLLDPDFFVPLTMTEEVYPGSQKALLNRGQFNLNLMGRLQPGVSVKQSEEATNIVTRQLSREFPETNKGQVLKVYPELRARPEPATGDLIPRLAFIFMTLVGLVLLIACANVANLSLARSLARRKELAIRISLGSSPFRVVRQVLTESMILGVFGGIAGFILACWAISLLAAIRLPSDIPIRLFEATIDWRIFGFNLSIALLTGILAGLLPAFQGSRADVNETLKEGGRSSTGAPVHHRLRSALVVSQVAVSLLILICAGLLIRSMKNAEKADLGFQTDHLLAMSFDVRLQGYDPSRGAQFYKQVIDRVKALPGVRSASLSLLIPMGYDAQFESVYPEGHAPIQKSEAEIAFSNNVDPGYFQTMRIPIVAGRTFTPNDNESSLQVAVINETMAQRFWPGQDPIGKRFQTSLNGPLTQVVGVTRPGKYLYLYEPPRSFFYVPLAQKYRTPITLELFTQGDPLNYVSAVRAQIHDLDPSLPVYDVKTMESHIMDGKAMLPARLAASIAGIFGLLGLALAVIGIYGVMSYSVSQRTHELGVRMALGARPWNLIRMVFRQGLSLTLTGLTIGLVLALLVTRLMKSILYGVSATDWVIFTGVSIVLTFVAGLACYIPAYRAARVDPLIALRYE